MSDFNGDADDERLVEAAASADTGDEASETADADVKQNMKFEDSAADSKPSRTSEKRWLNAITRAELDDLLKPTDWRSWVSVGVNWGLVFASFALVAAFPNPLTVLVALFVIGARQLGMAILMHEAAHRSLFDKARLNDWAGNWLAAYPIWLDVYPYRTYHLTHHNTTWTAEDPDIALAFPFPITRASLRR